MKKDNINKTRRTDWADDYIIESNAMPRIKKQKQRNFFWLYAFGIFWLLFLSWSFYSGGIRIEKRQSINQSPNITAPETHLAFINGVETVIYTDQDGMRSARIAYEYCRPLKFIDNCRNENEIIGIKF